jgi:hypothetical protein
MLSIRLCSVDQSNPEMKKIPLWVLSKAVNVNVFPLQKKYLFNAYSINDYLIEKNIIFYKWLLIFFKYIYIINQEK